ncbi:MAG: FlgD immunoglobulin-like domain containing protein [Candidatus Eisenbacteria bacterium]
MSNVIQTTAFVLGAAALTAGAASAGFLTHEDAMTNRSSNTQGSFKVLPAWTVGEAIDGYLPVGVPDGMGAYLHDDNTVRVFVNHELGATQGYAYELGNGTLLTGGRVSYFDFNRRTRRIDGAGPAYSMIIDRYGDVVTDGSQISETDTPTTNGLDRPCSANLFTAGQFNLEDTIFFTGEETGTGQEFALDAANGILYCAPAMGRAAWESCTLLDTGDDFKVAAVVGDDRGGAPLLLFVGEKNYNGDGSFLDRNGLAYGKLYVWVEDNGAQSVEDWNGTGSTTTGTFVEIEHYQPDMAGMPGFDNSGWANQDTQDGMAAAAGAFQFSRPEDVATSPNDGTVFAMASTGRGSSYPSDNWGTCYIFDVDFGEVMTASATIIYDADDAGAGQFQGPDYGLRSPDNLTWSGNGKIYFQEDRSTTPGSLFGGESGAEASVWEYDAGNGQMKRVLEMDRSAVPTGQVDTDPTDIGNWESSGVLDVTNLFEPRPAETLLILNVQAHSVTGPVIQDENLVQGGQILLASKRGGGFGSHFDSIWSVDFDLAASLQLQVGPNPSVGRSTVAFQLPNAGNVDIAIFDASGRQVRSLASGLLSAGAHSMEWNGQDDSGREAPAGMYFVRVATENGTAREKVMVVR